MNMKILKFEVKSSTNSSQGKFPFFLCCDFCQLRCHISIHGPELSKFPTSSPRKFTIHLVLKSNARTLMVLNKNLSEFSHTFVAIMSCSPNKHVSISSIGSHGQTLSCLVPMRGIGKFKRAANDLEAQALPNCFWLALCLSPT